MAESSSSIDSKNLATAFAQDVISACSESELVSEICLVTNEPSISKDFELSVTIISEPANFSKDPLNSAIEHAARQIRSEKIRTHANVIVLAGDLPAIKAQSLDHLLSNAPTDVVSFVCDQAGAGTTMVTIPHSCDPATYFGIDSARRHADVEYADLTDYASADLRLDVDTPSDLEAATSLGLGRYTQRLLSG